MRLFDTAVVVLAVSCGAFADSSGPIHLIHQVSEKYRGQRSIELSGHLSTALPDTKFKIRVEAIYAAAGHSFVPKGSNLVKLGPAWSFKQVKTMNAKGDDAGTNFPVQQLRFPNGWGSFERIDVGVKSATESPSETLEFDGKSTNCRVVQVDYDTDTIPPEERTVKYWIDPNTLLVLKQEFVKQQGHHHPPVFWRWVYAVDSVKFNQAPPQWLVDIASRAQESDHPRPEWVGRTAPDFVLPDLDGRQVNASSMHGLVVVLDFWATWCGPCKRELPIVQKIAEDYKSQGVQVWGISQDEEPSTVKKWMSDNGMEFRTLIDPDAKTAEQYEVKGIPALVVVGRSGKIVSYYEGNQSEQSLRSAIEAALHEVSANK